MKGPPVRIRASAFLFAGQAGVNVLFGKADRFQGGGLGRIERPPQRPVIAESERLKEALLHLDSAATATGSKSVADDGPIALLDHIKRLGPYPLEDLSQAGYVVTHPGVTPIRHVVGFRDTRTELHRGRRGH